MIKGKLFTETLFTCVFMANNSLVQINITYAICNYSNGQRTLTEQGLKC